MKVRALLYKVYDSGKYTRYETYITDDRTIVVCYIFKKRLIGRFVFVNRDEIMKNKKMPSTVKESAKAALVKAHLKKGI